MVLPVARVLFEVRALSMTLVSVVGCVKGSVAAGTLTAPRRFATLRSRKPPLKPPLLLSGPLASRWCCQLQLSMRNCGNTCNATTLSCAPGVRCLARASLPGAHDACGGRRSGRRADQPKFWAEGCQLGTAAANTWVHLRLCGTSGRRLLRRLEEPAWPEHFHATQHPITTSIEPGEHWIWCYVDELVIGAPCVT